MFFFSNGNDIEMSGNAGAGKSSAAYSEMVHTRHHGTPSERFQTVAHRLQNFASY